MAIKYHGIEEVPLTKELAEKFATMPHLRNERDFKKERVAVLRRKVDDGLFFYPRWATVVYQGKMFRINGQHSSHMLAELNGEFPSGLKAIVDRFSCDTECDCAILFEQFDDRRSARSGTEIVTGNARVYQSLDVVAPTTLSRIVAGLGYALSNLNEDGRPTVYENAKLLHEHHEFVLWADPYARTRNINKVGVIAALYATWLRDRDAAKLFWDAVRDETAPLPTDPTRVLARFLIESATDGSISGRKKWNQKAFYVKSIHAWNAWRDGTTTQLKYHPNAAPPSAK